ncbi:MAG: zf-HC2 domain-containing protein [Armatimonadota bacterium]
MKCALIRWWMEEYIDGTLKGKRLQWVREHLQGCRACAQELEWRRSLHEAMKPEPLPAPPQDMWQDFQRRLAERAQPACTPRVGWWQLGTATAAVVCVLALGVVWWSGRNPAPEMVKPVEPPGGQQFASGKQQGKLPAAGGAGSPVSPSPLPTRSPVVKPVHTAKAPPVRRPEPPPPPVRVAVRPVTQPTGETQPPAPQVLASMAYAEVRNEQGELVSRVLLQTIYDQNGQPRAVHIEYDTPAVVEVERNDQPMDSSDTHSDTRGSADSPTPTAGTRPGLSD